MNIKFSPPDIREEDIKAVTEVLRSGWITTGPKTKLFEKELAAYCGTTPLHAALSAMLEQSQFWSMWHRILTKWTMKN